MKKFFVLSALLLSIAAAPALCPAEEIDRVVAVVGQNVVTLSELQSEMAPAMNELSRKLSGDEFAAAAERLRKNTLNSLVDKYIQLQEAKTQGIEVTDEEVNAAVEDVMKKNNLEKPAFLKALASEGYGFDDYRKALSEQLMIMRLVAHAVKSKVAIKEEDVKRYYEENKERMAEPETVKLAAIFFPAQGDMKKALENAEAARKEVAAGASFEDTAVKYTGDKEAGKTSVMGVFKRGELSPDIETAAFGLKAGEVSGPLQAEGGYRLVKVVERAEPGVKKIEDVRAKIVDTLAAKQSEGILAKWMQELRSRTYVEIRL